VVDELGSVVSDGREHEVSEWTEVVSVFVEEDCFAGYVVAVPGEAEVELLAVEFGVAAVFLEGF